MTACLWLWRAGEHRLNADLYVHDYRLLNGAISEGQWEGVAPVASTFLLFLRNFSKGLRNVAESECLVDHAVFVQQ